MFLLGSNDPNTIPGPTRIRCSRFRIVSYVSARTPLCLDLATFYVSSDSVISGYVSRDFVDICFMLHLSLFPMFPSCALCFIISLSRTPQFPLYPILLFSLRLLSSRTRLPLRRIRSLVYILRVLVTVDLRTNIAYFSLVSV